MKPILPCTDLGCTTSIEMITDCLSLGNKRVIDAGCGSMAFTRPLLEHGAHVLGIDPDPIQAALNRAAAATPHLEFVETGAENLPADDRSIDGIFFSYSLHHISAHLYPAVFSEAFRVLRPDGFLCVIEPMACPLNDVMKLFHDEDRERQEAQQALREFAVPAFKTVQIFTYHSFTQYASFEKFAEHFSDRSFNDLYDADDLQRPEVRLAFERLGQPDYRFQSPKQAMILQQPVR